MQPSLLLVSLICSCCFQHSAAIAGSGFLGFLILTSPSTLSPSDDGISPPVHISSGFRFGQDSVTSVYVSINGYISMGTSVSTTSPRIPGTNRLVSPYGDDIDTRATGSVRYTQFTTADPQMSTVSTLIRSRTPTPSFYGTSMMVVEWNSVPAFSQSASITTTFQAVLITDGWTSYAVFIYQCGGMGWGGATIGWAYSNSLYEKHSLSGRSYSDDIGCHYSPTSSAVVYRIDSYGCESSEFACHNGQCVQWPSVCNGIDDCGDNSDEEEDCGYCSASQFTCDNGECESLDFVCDGFDDCGDNSDEEQDCDDVNVGLAVGISLGFLFLFCFCGILSGCVFFCSRKRRPLQARVIATTLVTGATTVVTTTQNTVTTPAPYPTQPPLSPYSTPPPLSPLATPQQSPVVYHSPMMAAYPQFGPGVAPPSYDAASTYPSYPIEGVPQLSPVAPYPPPQPSSLYPPHSGYLPSPSYPSSPTAPQ